MDPTTVGANLYHSSIHNVICFLYLLLLDALVSGHGICLYGNLHPRLLNGVSVRCLLKSKTRRNPDDVCDQPERMSISNHSSVALK